MKNDSRETNLDHEQGSERKDRPATGLAVVAVPIGNLEDMSPRAVRTLQEADLILAEDTRSFSRLASRFEIQGTVRSFHEHNEKSQVEAVLSRLKEGAHVALTSEAGTPGISDPGYRLISACRREGVAVYPVPGPSAAIAALSVSGLETDRFMFEGFLPQKDGKRRSALSAALERTYPTIFYESPYRVVKTLKALAELEPQRTIFLARELTKLYEETILAPAQTLYEDFSARRQVRGEFVLIVQGLPRKARKDEKELSGKQSR